MIQAVKEINGQTQFKNFSEEVWNLLKGETNGWVKVSDSIASNTLDKKPMPEIGTATNQVVENELTKIVTPEVVIETVEVFNENENEAEFLEVVKQSITKNNIKNHLDEINEPYKNTDSLTDLSKILYKLFNGNIAELKSKYGI